MDAMETGCAARPWGGMDDLYARGRALDSQGNREAAMTCYQEAIRLNPDHAEALYTLGNALQEEGRLDQAIVCYKRVACLEPDAMAVYFNLGNALLRKGMAAEAVNAFERSLELDPELPEAYCNMGTALKTLGQLEASVGAYKKAIDLKPAYYDAINNLGIALQGLGKISEARSCFENVLSQMPQKVEAWNNLGNAFKDQGDIGEAGACYRHALNIRPDYVEAHSNLLFTMYYDPEASEKRLLFEAQAWWEQHGKDLASASTTAHRHQPNPEKRLRVGYVSPDFRTHSVGYFFISLLRAHDSEAVETFCYAELERPDEMTRRLEAIADHWRFTKGLSDGVLAEKIEEDGIDILVDLAGHTNNHRLLTFAGRPAPIQVAWLGYPGTTGMPVMDYRFTDAAADPEGVADPYYTEELWRLPGGFLCYTPPDDMPQVLALPALKEGRICFGSFNNISKVNDRVVRAWSEILKRVPKSCLLLKGKALTDERVRRRYGEMFAACGIPLKRVEFRGYVQDRRAHFALYNRVDIGLDPFPYNGTTTTCEALWMGVPVVTLRGSRHSARVGASILSRINMPEMVASSEDDYVEKAVLLATDPRWLAGLRSSMRERVNRSPLADAKAFAGDVETAYRHMWTAWCEEKVGSSMPTQEKYNTKKMVSSVREKAVQEKKEADRLYQMGLSHHLKGRVDEAVECYKKALHANPDHAAACNNLGVAFQDSGNLENAVHYLKRAVSLKPDYADAHINLGNLLQHRGDLDAAISCYEQALRLKPELSEAHNNIGNLLMKKGQASVALKHYEKSVQLGPNNAKAHCNMGSVLQHFGRFEEAVEWYQKALQLKSDYPACYNNMGAAHKVMGKLSEAFHCQKQALKHDPHNADAYNNMGSVLKEQLRFKEALTSYRKALSIRPRFADAHSNLLLAMHYDPTLINQEIFAESRSWGQRHGARDGEKACRHASMEPVSRLKIGYVSPDFREHSVGYFFLSLVEKHNRDKVECFCYSGVKRPDRMMTRIKDTADHWVSIFGMTDEEAAGKIAGDGVHILVDLAGHTSGGRLKVFARRPAPIQVTWLGYPNTTGLAAMDYRLTDEVSDPEGDADDFYTETLVRLPKGFLCYTPPDAAGKVGELPAVNRGRICFGSFNNLCKLNERVVRVWSQILKRVPGSSLLLKSRPLADADIRHRLISMFGEWGIHEDRFELETHTSTIQEHLSLYNRIDIGLDPFPYNGTTTTCEAMWMGVPVVTLKGTRHSARVGASLLTQVDLEDLIADTGDTYIEKAVYLSTDLERLKRLRSGMRERLMGSSLCDGEQFARSMESAYGRMWEAACQKANG